MAEVDYRQLSDTSLVMPNGQSLNVQRFTVNNQPWVIYPGKTPANGGTPLYVGTDGTNYQFYTYGAEDGYRLYQYRPAPGSPEDEKNLSKSQEVHTRSYGNDKPEKKFGGTMNYTSYLEDGGSLVQALIEKVVQGQDQSALQQLVELAKEGNEEAIAFLQEVQGQSASMKCGGRVKKKALGSKLIKTQKAKCGCELKKVGGRLIEVDSCTGLPIHRNGGTVRKYQNSAGGGITFKDGAFYNNGLKMSQQLGKKAAQANWGVTYNDGNYYYLNDGTLYTQAGGGIGNQANSYGWKAMDWNKLDPTVAVSMGLRSSVDSKGNRFYYQQNDNGTYTRYGANAQGAGYAYGYGKGKDGKNYFYSNFGASDANWDPTKNTWTREGFNYDPNKGWSVVEPEQPVVENPKKDPAAPQAPSTGTPGLFTGDLRSYGARKQWISDNAEYLKSQGWDDARIAGYRGSAADNIALQKAISGKSAWDQEQAQNAEFARQRELDRQKQLAFENEMANSRSVDAAGYRSKPVRTQPLTMQERYSQLTPWEREQITFSNDQLKNMNPAQALYLPKMQYDQYLNLKFNR